MYIRGQVLVEIGIIRLIVCPNETLNKKFQYID